MANALTLLRLLLSPFFIIFFCWGVGGDAFAQSYVSVFVAQVIALVIAVLFEFTDIMDGVIARKFKQETDLGKVIDPLADSISRFSCFLSFLAVGYISVWPVVIVFYRDAIVSTLRGVAAKAGVAMGARASGKIKAIVQGTVIISICFLIVAESLFSKAVDPVGISDQLRWVVVQLMWVVALTTFWSLVDYLWAGREFLTKVIKGK